MKPRFFDRAGDGDFAGIGIDGDLEAVGGFVRDATVERVFELSVRGEFGRAVALKPAASQEFVKAVESGTSDEASTKAYGVDAASLGARFRKALKGQ